MNASWEKKEKEQCLMLKVEKSRSRTIKKRCWNRRPHEEINIRKVSGTKYKKGLVRMVEGREKR